MREGKLLMFIEIEICITCSLSGFFGLSTFKYTGPMMTLIEASWNGYIHGYDQ